MDSIPKAAGATEGGGLILLMLLLSAAAGFQEVSAHYTLGHQGVNGPEAPRGSPDSIWINGHVTQAYSQANGYQNFHVAYVSPGLFYQPLDVQQNYYSPDGAIIVETTGNLYFYLNISNPANLSDPAQPGLDISWERHNGRARWLYVAIPPEFTPAADTPSGWRVVTSITIDYHFIKSG
jgi:hypothetical protein